MRIVWKALVKSLINKKARTLLVLFSIAVSAALIFANESFSKICEQRFYEADVRWGGSSDFYIESKEAAGAEEWIDIEKLAHYKDKFEYIYQFISGKALYAPSIEEMHYFKVIGADRDEFNHYNPITLREGDFGEWDGFEIIIGETYAKIFNLKVNDKMKLELNGVEYDFKIVGISEPKGLFLRELVDGGFILAPKSTLSKIFKGESNLVFLKLKDISTKAAMKEVLVKDFAAYQVDYGVDEAVIEAETQNYVMPFRISSIAVIFMSMFIIFTAFNLITMERIPLIGILRSVGTTRKRINKVLLVESACFGAIGGSLGCILGIGVLKYIKSSFFNGEEIIDASSTFSVEVVIVTVGAAVIITVLSAIIPILRITKIPIKNIMLNAIDKKQKGRNRLWWMGFVFFVLCVVATPLIKRNFTGMIIGCMLATGALVGFIPVIQVLTHYLSRQIGKISFISYDIILGVRNIRDNKSLMNNIQLFSASIAIVAFMGSIFNTMGADLLRSVDENMKYDISVTLRHSNEEALTALSQVSGVEAYAGVYEAYGEISNYNTFFNIIYGIEDENFFNYNPVKQLEPNKEAIENLNNGKNIITTNVLKDKLGLEIGDTLVIPFGSKKVNYTITGFVESNVGIGHVGYISAENCKEDAGISDYSEIFVKTEGNADSVKKNIKRALTKEIMSIDTKKDLAAANNDKVMGMFKAISSYSYIALMVGIIGIVNNLTAGFIERKRNFAIYQCIGMSKKSLGRMLVAEAVATGIYGVCFGLACAVIMSSTIPLLVGVFWGNIQVQLAVKEMVVMGTVGILAMLIIAAVPVVKSSKLSIIQSIKYE